MSLQQRLSLLSGRVAKEFVGLRSTLGQSRRMQPFHLALSSQEEAACNIFSIGDSVMEGAVSGASEDRMLYVMEKTLRDKYGGAGYTPAWTMAPFVPVNARYSVTPANVLGNSEATPVQYDTGLTSTGFAGKRLGLQKEGWVEWDFVGNRVRVWYDRTTFFGISANVLIDGVVVTTLNGGGADGGAYSWLSDDVGFGKHVVRIQASVHAGSFWLEGVDILADDHASGVHVYDGSRSGARSLDYAAPTHPWVDSMAKVAPSLVLMWFGFNDMTQRTPAQFKADMQGVVDRVSATLTMGTYSLVIVASWSPNPGPAAGWGAYVKAMEEVANSHPYGVCLRLIDRWPVMQAGTGNSGMWANDTVHPSPAGQRLLGRYLADSLDVPKRTAVQTNFQWKDVEFLNGWSNYGGSYPTAQYLVSRDGWVRIRGMITGGTAVNAFKVPLSLAPANQEIFITVGRSQLISRVDVLTDGTVRLTQAGAIGDWAPVNGISWMVGAFED